MSHNFNVKTILSSDFSLLLKYNVAINYSVIREKDYKRVLYCYAKIPSL